MDGSLPKWCSAVALSRQDGRQSAVALLLKAALIQVSDYRLLGASGLLHCENYIVQRNIFLTGIREINNDLPIDELTLLFGNEILNDEKNTQIFLQVQKFIQDTGRFTIK